METEKYAFMERLFEAENKNIYIVKNIKQNKFIKGVQNSFIQVKHLLV